MKKPQLYLGNLNGEEGNAFVILGRARKLTLELGSKVVGADWETINAEATSGDYDHLLKTIKKYFEVI